MHQEGLVVLCDIDLDRTCSPHSALLGVGGGGGHKVGC